MNKNTSRISSVTYITGNKNKAKYLSDLLGISLEHQNLDLKEIQSLDLREVVEYKAKEAYSKIKKPVLVEDTSLEFTALGGKLPGTFIKFFLEEIDPQDICQLLDEKDRSATARSVFGFYDGSKIKFIEGVLHGKIAEKPAGNNGYGWDTIFIPDGSDKTRASMTNDEYAKSYSISKGLKKLNLFLDSII